MGVLVVGSVALDSVSTPFGSIKEALGGSAAYFAVAASFFTEVKLVAVVGTDFPKRYIGFFKKRGIDLKGLQIEKGKTFRWRGEYGYDLNMAKTIHTHLNVILKFNPIIPTDYKDSKYLFLANIDPVIQRTVLNQINRPKIVAGDTMNYWIENRRDELVGLLKDLDILLLNDAEAKELTQEANLIKAAKSIIKLGPRMVIIKKGEHGVLFFSIDYIFSAPAYLLETIYDPTGAGDTFAGGFIGYMSEARNITKSNIKRAIIYGSIMASYNVEDFSLNRLCRLKREEIEQRFKEFRKMTRF